MPEEKTQDATVNEPVQGQVKMGLGQIGNPTPAWATWVFRIYFYISQFASIYLALDPAVPAHVALTIIKYLGISVIAVHGLSKLVGIDSRAIEAEAKDAFTNTK